MQAHTTPWQLLQQQGATQQQGAMRRQQQQWVLGMPGSLKWARRGARTWPA
jgi:hypothetical protein